MKKKSEPIALSHEYKQEIFKLSEEILLDYQNDGNQVYLITSATKREGVSTIAKYTSLTIEEKSSLSCTTYTPPLNLEITNATSSEESHIAELCSNYNIVIIEISDIEHSPVAMKYFHLIDKAIIIIKKGGPSQKEVAKVNEYLSRHNIRLLGVVLNQYKPKIPTFLLKIFGV
ncbi:MAG: hypothetical protein MK193_00810 [Lentisphaeria bacterium]|nr:hypothetical protein [Lentisphaeria bacterium]